MEVLIDLYHRYYIQSAEYCKLGTTSEVKQAEDSLRQYMSKLDKNEYLNLDEVTAAIASAYEAQGFVYGYASCAMRVLEACGLKVGVVA